MSIPQLPPTPPCLAYNHRIPAPYGYRPSLAAGIVFSVIFAGSTACHAYQLYRYKRPWLFLFVLGGLGELCGWLARSVAWGCPYSVKGFEAQLASLIMSPAFTTAGMYATLAFMIPILGHHTSPLKPMAYVVIFMTVDFISGLLQAVGGGMAGAAFGRHEDTARATYVMISGIVFQLAATCVFSTLFEYVMWRGRHTLRHNRPLATLAAAELLTASTMVIRGVFRSMELMGGWRSFLATTERFQIVLEGTMMAVGLVTLNVFHPERLLRAAKVTFEASRSEDVALEDVDTVKSRDTETQRLTETERTTIPIGR